VEVAKVDVKFIWKVKRYKIANMILKKETKFGGLKMTSKLTVKL
jgi:hypothetical protein